MTDPEDRHLRTVLIAVLVAMCVAFVGEHIYLIVMNASNPSFVVESCTAVEIKRGHP